MVAQIERYQPTWLILQQLRKLWRIDQILVLDLLSREFRGAMDWKLYMTLYFQITKHIL